MYLSTGKFTVFFKFVKNYYNLGNKENWEEDKKYNFTDHVFPTISPPKIQINKPCLEVRNKNLTLFLKPLKF